MNNRLTAIAVIFLLIVSSVGVFGQNRRRTRTIDKPKTQIFLDGGNDSWNTRRRSGSKRKAAGKVRSGQTNILPYIEQQNIRKKTVLNGVGGSGNRRRSSGLRTRKKYANQEVSYRKKRKRRY